MLAAIIAMERKRTNEMGKMNPHAVNVLHYCSFMWSRILDRRDYI